MNPEYHTYELIDRYLNKQLSVDEIEQFNLKLSQDKEFATLVEAQKIANELIIDEQLSNLKKRMQNDLGGNEGTFNWKKPILFSGLLLLSTAGFYFYSQTDKTSTKSTERLSSESIGSYSKKPTSESELKFENGEEKSKTTSTNNTKPKLSAQETTNQEQISDFINTLPDEKETTVEKETVSTHVITAVPEEKTPDCKDVKITVVTTSVNSCIGKTDGAITIDLHSIKGGTSPYLFSLKENTFTKQTHFSNLEKGNYIVIIKDNNNCISTLEKPVIIEEKWCHELIDDAFMPGNGETWKFPLKENSEATIKIISKGGIVVYSAKISGGYPTEWDGRSSTGSEVDAGMYHFNIEYGNGQQQQGYISIVK